MREFLRSAIRAARVTACRPDGDDAVVVDRDLLAAADLLPLERITVTDAGRGVSFEAVCAAGPPGDGAVVCSGDAARRAAVGDVVTIAAYARLEREDLPHHVARVVELDEHNRVRAVVARTPFDVAG